MKEKIKNWIRKYWVRVAEIGTIIWAINGMNNVKDRTTLSPILSFGSKGDSYPHLGYLLFYFLSAVLILYLLRKYERKN